VMTYRQLSSSPGHSEQINKSIYQYADTLAQPLSAVNASAATLRTARELAGRAKLRTEETEGVGGVVGEMAAGGSDGGAVVAADQRAVQIAHCGQDLGCGPRAAGSDPR
jgi:hypothetical protein